MRMTRPGRRRPILRMTRRSLGRYRDRPGAISRAVDERPVGVVRLGVDPQGTGGGVSPPQAAGRRKPNADRGGGGCPAEPSGSSVKGLPSPSRVWSRKVRLRLQHTEGREGQVGQPVVHEVAGLPTREEFGVEADQASSGTGRGEPEQSLSSRWLRLSAASAAITWAKPAK